MMILKVKPTLRGLKKKKKMSLAVLSQQKKEKGYSLRCPFLFN
jgi:hypothetical protein